jgi:hypothetical protein
MLDASVRKLRKRYGQCPRRQLMGYLSYIDDVGGRPTNHVEATEQQLSTRKMSPRGCHSHEHMSEVVIGGTDKVSLVRALCEPLSRATSSSSECMRPFQTTPLFLCIVIRKINSPERFARPHTCQQTPAEVSWVVNSDTHPALRSIPDFSLSRDTKW